MKSIAKYTLIGLALLAATPDTYAQATDNSQSSGSVVRRRSRDKEQNTANGGAAVTQRMQAHYENGANISDADMQWMRVIYRELDLGQDKNAPLYFPEEKIEGQDNLLRIIMAHLADGTLPAYEYLDGREVFTDQYRVKVGDLLERFYISATPAKGSTERNPKYEILDSDIPTNEVLSYYVIERYEFDTRNNRMNVRVEAICPVLHRMGDFGGDAVKYPMFWVKYDDLRPYLSTQSIFVDDDNNLPTCTYDDYFTLNMYQGDIYKTRNLKNKSMMQMYPDPDDRKRAQDSIQNRLDNFEKKLWVANREDIIAAKQAKEEKSEVEATPTEIAIPTDGGEAVQATTEKKKNTRTTARSKKSTPKKAKESATVKKSSGGSSSATKSVRKRKK